MAESVSEIEHVDEDETVEEHEKKIFLNHVDSYHGKNIARIFARAKPGSSREPIDEEETSDDEQMKGKQQDFYDDQPTANGWKVSGTIQNSQDYQPLPFVQETVHYEDREQLLEYLQEMNVIIYDITQDPKQIDEAIWVCQKLESMMNELEHQIVFILLSTIMTWTNTDANDEGVPFTEDDFRRRRPHAHYTEHLTAEKIITKLGLTNKKKLSTYVVATGLTYGMEENFFHYLFKSAWYNTPELSIYNKTENFLPTIHIIDLAVILQNLADRQFKARYIVATDTSKDTLQRITRKVSQTLGMGKIKLAEPEEAMLDKNISQADYDMIFINMQFEPMFVKEHVHIKWHCENGLIENIHKIVEEYRIQRNLTPIKICILGPPASGKTTIAKQLAEEYRLHHLQIKDVIFDMKYELEQIIKRGNDRDRIEEEIDGEEPDETLADRIEEARTILEKFEDTRRNSRDIRLDEETIIQIVKMKLLSPPCQNQGYILDGYPETFDQAQSLFGVPDDGDEENIEERKPPVNERIIPEYVFILEASHNFLRERILHLPEKMVVGTNHTEFEFKRRMKFYNDLGDDLHAGKFFDDIDRPSETIKIDDDRSLNHRETVEKLMERIQKPHNYGFTVEEQELIQLKEIYEKEKREREEREEREREEQELVNKRIRQEQENKKKLEQIKQAELDLLDVQSVPLRNYLMAHVMPTLTKALIECCQVRPDDPIDFVAEYLFKNNPQM